MRRRKELKARGAISVNVALICFKCAFVDLTDVVVGHPLQQAGLVTSRGRPDAGAEQAEVRLIDVQREICSRAQFDLRAPLVVL